MSRDFLFQTDAVLEYCATTVVSAVISRDGAIHVRRFVHERGRDDVKGGLAQVVGVDFDVAVPPTAHERVPGMGKTGVKLELADGHADAVVDHLVVEPAAVGGATNEIERAEYQELIVLRDVVADNRTVDVARITGMGIGVECFRAAKMVEATESTTCDLIGKISVVSVRTYHEPTPIPRKSTRLMSIDLKKTPAIEGAGPAS